MTTEMRASAIVAGLLGMTACSNSDATLTQPYPEPGSEAIESIRPVEGYGPGVPFGPDESIFERDHVVEVQVEIAADAWETLRFEGMSIGEVAFPSGEHGVRVVPEYTEFSAQVTVDGVVHEEVAIKKKGYIGSLSSFRPSLKLNFSKLFDEELAAGMKRMTLNNDRQDPSHARQCMAYDLFAKLDLPAPRCNYAHVVVNGMDLGIYTHIEGIKKPMLARFFENTDGNLYEGELSDFAEETAEQLELKANEDGADRSDIQSVIDALSQADDQVVEAIGQVVDLDSFFDFWALETLLGHWDGYAGNSNNYRAYHDPTTDRFFFIPWGTDQTFVGTNPNSPLPYLSTVYATGAISNRLYALPEQRARFRQRLGELNDQLWDVPTLLDEVDDIAALAWDADPANLEVQRSYIRSRGPSLRAALQQPAPDWVDPPPEESPVDDCVGEGLALSGTFSTQWMDELNFGLGAVAGLQPESAATLQLEGVSIGGDFKALAGEFQVAADARVHRRALFFQEAVDESGRIWFLQMGFRLESVKPGYQRFHGIESNGFMGMLDPQTGDFQAIANVGGGGVQVDEVDLHAGGTVTGSFQATAYLAQCVETALQASEQARAALAAAQAGADGALMVEQEAEQAAE